MHTVVSSRNVPPPAVVNGLMIGWLLIVIKCLVAPVVIAYWHIPVHPGWVVVPTLLFAVFVTVLVFAHDWSHEHR